jgi:hypothetical protein
LDKGLHGVPELCSAHFGLTAFVLLVAATVGAEAGLTVVGTLLVVVGCVTGTFVFVAGGFVLTGGAAGFGLADLLVPVAAVTLRAGGFFW